MCNILRTAMLQYKSYGGEMMKNTDKSNKIDIVKVVYLTITSIIAWNIMGKLIDQWEHKMVEDRPRKG